MIALHSRLTPEYYEARVNRLRDRAIARGLDGLLLSDPTDIVYFAAVGGLSPLRSIWLLVPADGLCTLVLPRVEAPVAGRASWVTDQRQYVEWPEPGLPDHWAQPLVDALRERRCANGRLGIEYGVVTVASYEILRERLPGSEFVDVGPLIADFRRRKDSVELEIMRAGGQVAAAQLAGARAVIADGVPEYELGLAARAAGTRVAAELLGPDYHLMSPIIAGVQSIVASGPDRGAMAHARASTFRIRRGDIVALCFCGPMYLTYYLGFDRPLFVEGSKLESAQTRLIDVGLEAHDAALDTIRPGIPASSVHAAAARVMEAAGMSKYRAHRTGRGVGAGALDPPELRESDQTLLEPGMTFTVEPGIYIPGVGGARFGDTVAVTEAGYEILTPAPYGWRGR